MNRQKYTFFVVDVVTTFIAGAVVTAISVGVYSLVRLVF